MRILELSLKNFRCFEAYRLRLASRFTLLIGENGSGKTVMLDALAVAASSFLLGIPGVAARAISRDEIRAIDLVVGGTRYQGKSRRHPGYGTRRNCGRHAEMDQGPERPGGTDHAGVCTQRFTKRPKRSFGSRGRARPRHSRFWFTTGRVVSGNPVTKPRASGSGSSPGISSTRSAWIPRGSETRLPLVQEQRACGTSKGRETTRAGSCPRQHRRDDPGGDRRILGPRTR